MITGSLLRTCSSPPGTDIGYTGIPKGRAGALFAQEGARDTEASRCSALPNTAEAPLAMVRTAPCKVQRPPYSGDQPLEPIKQRGVFL